MSSRRVPSSVVAALVVAALSSCDADPDDARPTTTLASITTSITVRVRSRCC